MFEERTICRPVKVSCHITYYVLGTPFDDPHFKPTPPFIVDNRFFETREEAETLRKECNEKGAWVTYEVKEKVIPLDMH